jgi:ADP-ribosyl-[dinitrogen reductase] hydrolase
MTKPSLRERLEGGLLGLLIGDALGVPYEFHHPASLPGADGIEYTPPVGFRRAHKGVQPGTWSDDGAQALCLLASLLHCGRLDAKDLGDRLVSWQQDGYMAVDGRVFDIGVQTSRALRALAGGTPAEQAGPSGEMDNGNGSLMRVLPLALWHTGSDAELIADAATQSRVTHGHRRSELCCALYCLWARRVLNGEPEAWASAVAALVAHCPADEAEIHTHVQPSKAPGGQGTGYVVDCLHSARFALLQSGYEAAVKAAILLGRDTDTTAAVAGGIAGLREGSAAIPRRFVDGLRGRELLQPLLDGLLAHRAG